MSCFNLLLLLFYYFQQRVDQYFTQINKIIKARITSSRVRFMMQDVVDLRNNDWVPRREDNNPKTIDQIHKEAADEAKKAHLRIQMDKQQEKKMPRGISLYSFGDLPIYLGATKFLGGFFRLLVNKTDE